MIPGNHNAKAFKNSANQEERYYYFPQEKPIAKRSCNGLRKNVSDATSAAKIAKAILHRYIASEVELMSMKSAPYKDLAFCEQVSFYK